MNVFWERVEGTLGRRLPNEQSATIKELKMIHYKEEIIERIQKRTKASDDRRQNK